MINDVKKYCAENGHTDKDFIRKVVYDLQCSGLDFSECTKRQYINGIKTSIVEVENGTEYKQKGL